VRWALAGLLVSFAALGQACGGTQRAQNPREALSSEMVSNVPRWMRAEGLPPTALPGAKLFATSGCTVCHTYLGAGSTNLGAPDLTAIGSRHLGLRAEIRHLRCPACVRAGSPMPPFGALGEKRLRQLAVFLEASKGTR
jgi:hypothetical protein